MTNDRKLEMGEPFIILTYLQDTKIHISSYIPFVLENR